LFRINVPTGSASLHPGAPGLHAAARFGAKGNVAVYLGPERNAVNRLRPNRDCSFGQVIYGD